jgi:membrane protein
MEFVKKNLVNRISSVAAKITEHNLFLLSSSISYYSALAIAPFIIILLSVAAFLGQDIQGRIINQANTMSPDVGKMFSMIFENVNEVNFGSISGLLGIVILLSTSSLVFLQMRYSFDVIYGYFDPEHSKSLGQTIKERLFAMLMILMAGVFFILSFSLASILEYLFGPGTDENLWSRILVFSINFSIYTGMFTGIHFFAPSRRPHIKEAVKVALLSSVFFILGNILLASYLKGIAANSIYGAAGTLLVFLTWSYYSSFTLFLSVELFLYLKRKGRY